MSKQYSRLIVGVLVMLSIAVVVVACCNCPPSPAPPSPPSPPPPDTHAIVPNKELLITALPVVNDARATEPSGVWSFAHLMTAMSGGHDPAEFTKRWLLLLATREEVNGFEVPPRSRVRQVFIEPWKRKDGQPDVSDENWRLNLANAPFRLLGIVNRLDLVRPDESDPTRNVPEGRFVFGALHPETGQPLRFFIIYEYSLVHRNPDELRQWARDWHHLGSFAGFDDGYRAALEAVTERFAGRNAAPNRPNGSALSQLRTNDLTLGTAWELREFVIDPGSGLLVHTTVKQTPSTTVDDMRLGRYLRQDETLIRQGRHTVPLAFGGQPFLGGVSPEERFQAPVDPTLVSAMAKFTCMGCHRHESVHEGVPPPLFVHLEHRQPDAEAAPSDFLNADLKFRAASMEQLLADPKTALRVQRAFTTPPARVH